MEVVQAVKGACRYVEAGIKTAVNLGQGNGPINHFHSTYTLPFAPYVVSASQGDYADFSYSGYFVEYLLERADVKDVWREHTHHEFVAGLADGSLPVEAFKYYLVQDYLYLVSILLGVGTSSDRPRYNSQERMR